MSNIKFSSNPDVQVTDLTEDGGSIEVGNIVYNVDTYQFFATEEWPFSAKDLQKIASHINKLNKE